MTADELRDFLTQRDVKFEENEIQHGTRFKCGSGEVIVAYNTGTVSCQGKPTELSKAVKDWKASGGSIQSTGRSSCGAK